MIKNMTARYPGRCARTGAPISPGDSIQYDTTTRQAWIAHAAGNYSRYQSNYTRLSSGAELYRNKAGRCIDAPCCGCCNY